jgi:hypothetical protein
MDRSFCPLDQLTGKIPLDNNLFIGSIGFSPHSTRMTATSKTKAASVPMHEIFHTAGWSLLRSFDWFYKCWVKDHLGEGSRVGR